MEYLIAVLKNKERKKEHLHLKNDCQWLIPYYVSTVNNQYQIDKKSLESLRSFNWTRQWPEKSEMKYFQPSLLILETANSILILYNSSLRLLLRLKVFWSIILKYPHDLNAEYSDTKIWTRQQLHGCCFKTFDLEFGCRERYNARIS